MPTARLDFEFLDRVVTPVNCAIGRVGADNFAAGREVIQLAAAHCGRGRALTTQMSSERDVVRDLPEELAVGFPERPDDGNPAILSWQESGRTYERGLSDVEASIIEHEGPKRVVLTILSGGEVAILLD